LSTYGNVIWAKRPGVRERYLHWSIKKQTFVEPHPCAGNPKPTVFNREQQPETDDPLGKFRARGYLASCFPEGDGMSFDPPPGRTEDEVERDLVECFGFEIRRGR
jgi:hypothetical protein